MRHRVYGKHLSRDKNQRTALFRSLVRELFLHESIKTTEPKAKAIKGLVDTLISKGKKKDSASLRVVSSFLVQPELIKKLTEDISKRYSDRPSGFTSTVRLGSRLGDGAMIVKMSLMASNEKPAVAKKEKEEKVAVEVKEVKSVAKSVASAKPVVKKSPAKRKAVEK